MYLHHFCILGGLYIKIQHHQLHHILQQVVAESCVGQKVPSCWIYTPSTCLVGQRWRCLPNWSWPKCRRRNLDGWGASQRVEVMTVLACLDSFDRYVEQNYTICFNCLAPRHQHQRFAFVLIHFDICSHPTRWFWTIVRVREKLQKLRKTRLTSWLLEIHHQTLKGATFAKMFPYSLIYNLTVLC